MFEVLSTWDASLFDEMTMCGAHISLFPSEIRVR